MKNIKELIQTTGATTMMLFGFVFFAIVTILEFRIADDILFIFTVPLSVSFIIIALLKCFKNFRLRYSIFISTGITLLMTIATIFLLGWFFWVLYLSFS